MEGSIYGGINVAGKSTWSGRPSASSMSNKIWLINDIGNGALIRSNGTRWLLMSVIPLYNTGSTATTVTNTTAETQVAAFTLPGALLGPNGYMRLMPMTSQTNSANTKTMRVKFGASTVIAQAFGGSGSASAYGMFTIRNIGSVSSQKATQGGSVGVGTTSSAIGTASVNTDADVTVTITVQMGALAETVTLENLVVEVGSGA